MKKRLNRLRNISIRNRLRWSFFFLCLLPLLIVGVFAVTKSKEAIISKSTTYIEQITNALGSNIDNELIKYENLIDELILNSAIQMSLRDFETMTVGQKTKMKEDITNILQKKFSYYPYIKDVKIINNQDEQIYQRGYLLNDESHIDNIMKDIKREGGVTKCFATEIYDHQYIVMSKVIYSIYDRSKVGYMVLVLKEESVKEIYKEVTLGEGDNLFLIDRNNKMLSSKHLRERGTKREKDVIQAVKVNKQEGKNKLEFKDMNKRYLLIHNNIQQYNIEVVASIPYEYLHKEITSITQSVILVMGVCFILSFMASSVIAGSITKPLHSLVDYVGQAMDQKFDEDFIDDSKDELGVVGRTFIIITRRMKEMIEQIEKEQQEKTELEINMLQAQINPHFLFNTLNSLRWISMMSGAHSVSEGILALSDLLRNTIIHKAEYITIEDELENVKNYMLIQKLRYGDLFDIQLEIPDEYLEYKTLKFILQPIVENAIIHGGCEEQQSIEIRIRLSEEKDGLLFQIEDNGKGFDKEEVRKNRHPSKLSGIGVQNVRERIRLNFGNQYGLEVESCLGEGTKVILYIPKIRGEMNV